MITLYTFGPAFGLPDPSPFVMKAEMLLKLSGLPYQTNTKGFGKAPKGKLPYIEDEGVLIADSSFIRMHLEQKYRIDFERGLSPEQRGAAWAFEKMVEDHLYFAAINERWLDDAQFAKGPVNFFKRVPAPLRPLIIMFVRRKVRQQLYSQGMGRHSPAEIAALAERGIAAISDYLGDKPFFTGSEPVGVDATMFAFIAAVLCPTFDGALHAIAARHDNLRRYVGRMTARFYPEWNEIAGCKAAA
jgi:glutathione S-transferase